MVIDKEYKNSEIGVIPKTWKVKSIGEIAEFCGGSQPPLEYFSKIKKNGYIRMVQIRDYKTDKYKVYIPEKLAKRYCDKSDIMIGRYGPPIFQILKGISGAYNVALIKATPKGVDKKYLYYLLKQEKLFKYIELLSRRSSGQTGVDLKGLKEYIVAIPDTLEEQKHISSVLSDIDKLILSTQKLLDKKKMIKIGSMQTLLNGKKRVGIDNIDFNTENYKETQMGTIPSEWSIKTFRDISSINQGLQISIEKRKSICIDNYQPYITLQWLSGDKSTEYISEYSNSVLCDYNDILMTRTGNTGMIVTGVRGVFHNNFFKINYNTEIIDKDYLVYYLRSNKIQKIILDKAGASTIPDLKHKDFYSIPVVLPSLREQKMIANILLDMDKEIEKIEEKLDKYKKIKHGMMEELLTGKRRLV